MSKDDELDKISIIMIGDTAVGKSTLMKKFITGKFSDSLAQTIGVELYKKEIVIDNKKYLYRIWDTCGQERFRSLSKSYFRSSDGIMLLFDLNTVQSFDNINIWIESIKENGCEDIPIILVGTKCDLNPNVSDETIQKFQKDNDLIQQYYKCSSKDDIGINEPFIELAKLVIKLKKPIEGKNTKITIRKDSNANQKEKKRRWC